jgi:hypothetical protein
LSVQQKREHDESRNSYGRKKEYEEAIGHDGHDVGYNHCHASKPDFKLNSNRKAYEKNDFSCHVDGNDMCNGTE